MQEEINRWYKKIWETRGCRFNAFRRLNLHDSNTTLTLTLVSIYMIGLSLIDYLHLKPETWTVDGINFFSIIASIIVLAISLILANRDYKGRALKFHDCGKELGLLYDKVQMWKSGVVDPTQADFEKLHIEYNAVLQKHDTNHEDIDYRNFVSQNIAAYSHIKNPIWYRFKTWYLYKRETALIYWLINLFPIIAILLKSLFQ